MITSDSSLICFVNGRNMNMHRVGRSLLYAMEGLTRWHLKLVPVHSNRSSSTAFIPGGDMQEQFALASHSSMPWKGLLSDIWRWYYYHSNRSSPTAFIPGGDIQEQFPTWSTQKAKVTSMRDRKALIVMYSSYCVNMPCHPRISQFSLTLVPEIKQGCLATPLWQRSFTQLYCTTLLSLHALTRCYTTSAMKGCVNVKPLKILQKCPEYQEVLMRWWRRWRYSHVPSTGRV